MAFAARLLKENELAVVVPANLEQPEAPGPKNTVNELAEPVQRNAPRVGFPWLPFRGKRFAGAAGQDVPVTVNAPDAVLVSPPGDCVPVTSRGPVVADGAMVILTVACDELLIVVELTVMPDPKLNVVPL
jgi:hypothetical protein